MSQDGLRALIEELATDVETLQQAVAIQGDSIATLQQTIGSQNETIVMLEETIDEKCETIERQQMSLQQLNDSLQMFVENQGNSSSLRKRFKIQNSENHASALCLSALYAFSNRLDININSSKRGDHDLQM